MYRGRVFLLATRSSHHRPSCYITKHMRPSCTIRYKALVITALWYTIDIGAKRRLAGVISFAPYIRAALKNDYMWMDACIQYWSCVPSSLIARCISASTYASYICSRRVPQHRAVRPMLPRLRSKRARGHFIQSSRKPSIVKSEYNWTCVNIGQASSVCSFKLTASYHECPIPTRPSCTSETESATW